LELQTIWLENLQIKKVGQFYNYPIAVGFEAFYTDLNARV